MTLDEDEFEPLDLDVEDAALADEDEAYIPPPEAVTTAVVVEEPLKASAVAAPKATGTVPAKPSLLPRPTVAAGVKSSGFQSVAGVLAHAKGKPKATTPPKVDEAPVSENPAMDPVHVIQAQLTEATKAKLDAAILGTPDAPVTQDAPAAPVTQDAEKSDDELLTEAVAQASAKKSAKAPKTAPKTVAPSATVAVPPVVAVAGKLTVSRSIKKNGQSLADPLVDEPLDIVPFATTPASVSVSVGQTISLPTPFEFLRMDVGVTLPCYAAEVPEALALATSLAGERMMQEVADAKQAFGMAP